MLYLTYNNNIHKDGAGSQLQRILSIYMIAKYYGIGYLHNPILKTTYTYDNEEDNKKYRSTFSYVEEHVDEFNNMFALASDKLDGPIHATCTASVLTKETILQILNTENTTEKNIILASTYGGELDKNPDLHHIKINYPWIQRTVNSVVKIAIHIRKGDLSLLSPERVISDHYYIGILEKLHILLRDAQKPHEFHIYSDGYFDKEKGIVSYDTSNYKQFCVVPNVQFHIGTHPVQSIVEMTNSDILVLSNSCFSYVPAILKLKGVVLGKPGAHSMAQNWIVVNDPYDVLWNKLGILTRL